MRVSLEQSSGVIIGLSVNTETKYGASVYVCTLILTELNKDIKK